MTESRFEFDAAVTFTSILTCPHCGEQHVEIMAAYSCAVVFVCHGCGTTLRPREGDCCVFCTYGSAPCPAIQMERRRSPLPEP